ncbi:hypothetical protein MTO96_022623 [Rhipicephalus appendiculatus]
MGRHLPTTLAQSTRPIASAYLRASHICNEDKDRGLRFCYSPARTAPFLSLSPSRTERCCTAAGASQRTLRLRRRGAVPRSPSAAGGVDVNRKGKPAGPSECSNR